MTARREENVMWMGVAGGIGLLAAAVVVWWVTAWAAAGKVGNNSVVGIRTRATMASEQAWRAGHMAAVPVVRVVAGVSGLLGAALILASAFAGSEEPTLLVGVLFAVGYGSLVVGALWAARVASQAARSVG